MQNIRLVIIVILIALVIWFYKDYNYQKHENQRQTENITQLRKADSLHYVSQLLTQSEINDYLQYTNSDLTRKLQADNIKLNRIESILSQTLQYKDTSNKQTDLTSIVQSVKQNVPNTTPIIDSTPCLTIKGTISYKNDSLKLNITERKFTNKTEAIAYWERKPWKFLGIKTRFLGKKQATAKVYNSCGETEIIQIEKKK